MLSLVLAEVSDKMASPAAMVVWNIVLAVSTGLLARKKSWWAALTVLPLLIAAMMAWLTIDELRDPYIGPAILHELGWGYIVSGLTPLFLASGIVIARLLRRPSWKSREA